MDSHAHERLPDAGVKMNQLFAGMYASASGALMLDLTNARELRFGTNEHGYSDFEALYPCGLAESFRIYDRPGLPHVSVVANGATAWEGRVEDVAIVNGGVRIKAFGYQRALSDAPHTGLYSDTRTGNAWRMWSSDDSATRNPNLYLNDTQNRVFIGLTKGASYANLSDRATFAYYAPDDGATAMTYFSGSYAFVLPTNWYMDIDAYTSALVLVGASTISSAGGTSSGSFACSWPASGNAAIVLIDVFNGTGSSYTVPSASESGAYYAKVTSPRITASGSTIYPSDISASLAAVCTGLPSTSSVLITANALDLQNEVYNDELPSAIMNRLVDYGATSGSAWEWGVYDGGLLHYRVRGSAGRAWYVDATELQIERTIQSLSNSVYAVYSDTNGRALRTAASTAGDSVARYGLTRTGAVKVDTTSATQAGYTRDVALTDGKNPSPRVALDFVALYDSTGAQWPLWSCRSGDTITMRNLQPGVSSEIDRIRTFRVSETDYDAMRDVLRVTPELPTPTLDVLVAQKTS